MNNSDDSTTPENELPTRDDSPTRPTESVGDGAPEVPRSIVGPYRIVKELGRGGMGTVYLAIRDQAKGGGRVALKILSKGRDTKSALDRFNLESHVLAGLQHPNIARFLDSGESSDGRAYFVMEYVEGLNIDRYCDSNSLSLQGRIKIFSQVCDAVQYAHSNLVIHRDLKPQNIVVSRDGIPKLLDFGIAKLLNPDMASVDLVTETSQRLMTPEYASPEQVRGEPVTTQSDVYSLGVLLYELLCGQRPYNFKARIESEFVRLVSDYIPERPSTVIRNMSKTGEVDFATKIANMRNTKPDPLKKQISGELDDIVMQAIEKAPGKRYASANEFSDDLNRHLSGQTVQARKPANRTVYHIKKYIGRHKIGTAISAAALATILGTGSTALSQWNISQKAKIKEAQSTQYAALVWNALTDSDANISLNVDQRKELYTSILQGFTDFESDPKLSDDDSRFRKVDVLMQLADSLYSIRGASERDFEGASSFLSLAQDELNAIKNTSSSIFLVKHYNLKRRIADLLKDQGKNEQAIIAYRQTIHILQNYHDLVDSQAQRTSITARINNFNRSIGVLNHKMCKLDIARNILSDAEVEARRLRSEQPENAKLRRDWTVAAYSLAEYHLAQGETKEAESLADQILSIRMRVLSQDLGNSRHLRDVVTAILLKYDIYKALDTPETSLELLTKASSYSNQARIIENSIDGRWNETHAIVLYELALTQASIGMNDELKKTQQNLRQTVDELDNSQSSNKNLNTIRSYPMIINAVASLLQNDEKAWTESMNAYEEILSENTEHQTTLTKRTISFADILYSQGKSTSDILSEINTQGNQHLIELDISGASCNVSFVYRSQFTP